MVARKAAHYPWDTAFRPLHSSIKMCSKTEMLVIASSFAAIIYDYVIIVQSCFSHVLNSKNEDGSTQRLQHLNEYAEGHRAVWIHRESGDVFTYVSNSIWLKIDGILIKTVAVDLW